MILVDTSVWVDHLRHGDAKLKALLTKSHVLAHPFVIGELALVSLRQRDKVLQLLADLPQAMTANETEALDFIKKHALHNMGIGYVDAHLLASARLSGARLWTRDKRLHAACAQLGLSDKH